MDSESSQDYFCLKDGEKDLMAYEEEEMLAFEQEEDSTMENLCEVIKPDNNASSIKEQNFSLLMSAINSFTSSDHSVSGDEPEKELMHPVCGATPQPEELLGMDTIENESTLSLLPISVPSPKEVLSQASNSVGDIQEGTVMSPSEIPDVEMQCAAAEVGDLESVAAQEEDLESVAAHEGDFEFVAAKEDLESRDNTAASQQSDEIRNEPPQPPTQALREVGHQLQLFHNEQIMLEAISIWDINDRPEQTIQEHFAFNGIDIAGHLLEAAAAQMELHVIVYESTLRAIANGLQMSIECGTGGDNPLIVHNGIGPMVTDLLLDSQTGIVQGFAVARLVPRPVINSTGAVQGRVMHQVTRGFAIDDNARRIITEGVAIASYVANQQSPSGE